jgi:hypothetical protein
MIFKREKSMPEAHGKHAEKCEKAGGEAQRKAWKEAKRKAWKEAWGKRREAYGKRRGK